MTQKKAHKSPAASERKSKDSFFLFFEKLVITLSPVNQSYKLMKRYFYTFFCMISLVLLMACQNNTSKDYPQAKLLFQSGEYPQAVYFEGKYYYLCQPAAPNSITIYESDAIETLPTGKQKVVFQNDGLDHIWSPELHAINGKWYIYFEADTDGNTDNHQLYVIENTSHNPMEGEWVLKGPLQTNEEWNFGLHPTVLSVHGELYLLWSGWPKRRVEHETQCIYIAHLKDPWTVDSERVMLSKPEYEWERQWINPDGSRSAYPIYVNENPEAFLSPDGRHVCVFYSASGVWTQFQYLGLLTAPATANLLVPEVWTKSPEPISIGDSTVYSASNIYLVPSDGEDKQTCYLLYQAKWMEGDNEQRGIFYKPVTWNNQGCPILDPNDSKQQ